MQKGSTERGNVFAPITTVNDATEAPLTGAAMMQEFARQMERKQGRLASVFPNQGAGHADLDFPIDAVVRTCHGSQALLPCQHAVSVCMYGVVPLTQADWWCVRGMPAVHGKPVREHGQACALWALGPVHTIHPLSRFC